MVWSSHGCEQASRAENVVMLGAPHYSTPSAGLPKCQVVFTWRNRVGDREHMGGGRRRARGIGVESVGISLYPLRWHSASVTLDSSRTQAKTSNATASRSPRSGGGGGISARVMGAGEAKVQRSNVQNGCMLKVIGTDRYGPGRKQTR